jgi:hypothetical protein
MTDPTGCGSVSGRNYHLISSDKLRIPRDGHVVICVTSFPFQTCFLTVPLQRFKFMSMVRFFCVFYPLPPFYPVAVAF